MRKYRIVFAIILLLLILSLPKATGEWSYPDVLRYISMTFKGQAPYSDIAVDFYGFHALVAKQDPYAILGPALKTIGVDWDVKHASTHPPTAYLVAAPAAILQWPLSSAVWSWLMFACLYLSLKKGIGYSWDASFLLTVMALYWPPIAISFGQITLVWLFGLMMAYRTRNTRPFWSGLFIGVASFTKFLPGLLLVPFILRRKWKAVMGFILSWMAASGVILMLSPNAFTRYFEANKTNSIDAIMRLDNGAFIMFLYNRIGTWGLVIAAIAIFLLLALTHKVWFQKRDEEISQEEWNLYSFMAVLLLPIAWIYSLSPLLPHLLSLLQNKKMTVRIVTGGAIVLPIIISPWGGPATASLFGFFVLSGIAIVLAQPLRMLFMRRSHAGEGQERPPKIIP